MYLYLLV